MASLEEFYEEQFHDQKKDDLNERLQKLAHTMVSTGLAFSSAKACYHSHKGKNPQFYGYEYAKLSKMEKEFHDFFERFENEFIKHPHLNHPNKENRKDLL